MRHTCAFVVLALSTATAYGQRLDPKRTYPAFGIGPTGIEATIEAGHVVTIAGVQGDSPAADTGLRAGDVLVSLAGLDVGAFRDPRVALGRAIGAAEADDGRMVVRFERGDETRTVTLALEELGAYSPLWPRECAKSTAIVDAAAEYVARCQREDGSYVFGAGRPEREGLLGSLAGLFLLSTGDDRYLVNVRRHARATAAAVTVRPTKSNWHLGYQGILLAEYFLRTGDEKVLPGLAALAGQAISAQAAGAWGHGGIPGPGYVQSGLMSSAGVPVLTTLILARECGVKVDERGYRAAVEFFYRMVGHGCVPYGDHRSELWWSNTNGRNGMLTCAFALLDDEPFQAAAQHLALLVADSYHQPEFGHTGGGFNVIWRGLASVHVPEARRSHYRRQLDELAWYYDLCRQPSGGFSILPTPPDNKRYQGLGWGTGAIGLTYTAPRATLRITGAPRTKYSVDAEPYVPDWGTPADRAFLSTDDAAGFGAEEADPKEVYDLLIGDKKKSATVAFCAKHLRHYSPLVRTWAARNLCEKNTPEAHAALAEAAGHSDPRVRRAAYDGVSGYDNWSRPMRGRMPRDVVSKEVLPAILATLEDEESAWWELDGALFALGHARPDDIRAAMPRILAFSRHAEWYLRDAAFWAIVGLGDSITGEEFEHLGLIYRDSRHVFERASFDGGFKSLLKKNVASLDRAARDRVLAALGDTTHSPNVADGYGEPGIHEAAHRTMMVLKHFDDSAYEVLLDDFDTYLASWTPYTQHSAWLIGGSKWQLGLLEVLSRLGAKGAPLHRSLTGVLERYDEFDPKRFAGPAKGLDATLRTALDAWAEAHGNG